MKVLLRGDIAGVGKKGDIVEVAEGFARNYLLPDRAAPWWPTAASRRRPRPCARSRDLRDAQDRESAAGGGRGARAPPP